MTPLPAQFVEWLKACNERFARFSGSQFSAHELPSEEKVPTTAKRPCSDFKCLQCGRSMRDGGERWECRCGFFYKPLVPGAIPKKYLRDSVAIKKRCRDCKKVEVTGMRRLCPTCAASSKRRSYRKSKAKSRSRVQKTGFSSVGVEALTKLDITGGYGSSGTPLPGNANLDATERVA